MLPVVSTAPTPVMPWDRRAPERGGLPSAWALLPEDLAAMGCPGRPAHVFARLQRTRTWRPEGLFLAREIREVRRQSRVLVTLGACATAGGIQSLRNFRAAGTMLPVVYAKPEYIDSLATSTGIAEHVPVDYELRGCPPNKHQLLEVVTAFLAGRRPNVASHSVCVECKLRGNVCVMVTGTPCLGPVTHDGCGALCPLVNAACVGCYGPAEGVVDFGARLMTAVASVIDSNDADEIEAILNGIPDPAGSFYRFGLPHSLLHAGKAAIAGD